MKKFLIILLVLFGSYSAWAEKIIFPEDELATESVLPKFDRPDSVRSRNIATAGRFEFGAFTGWASDEPIFNPIQFGGTATYHFDETHGLNLVYGLFGGGVNSYAKEINSSVGLDYTNAFGPKGYYLADYQFTGFYGKMSMAKDTVVNLHLFGLVGAGMMDFGGVNEMILNFGLGQKFYFSKNAALRFDMRFMRYNGPNPAAISKTDLNSGTKTAEDFESTSFLTTHLTVGVVFLL